MSRQPTLIARDNNACIFLVKGSGMYARAKHIDTRVHRVREFAAGDKPEAKLYKIAGEYQPADIFTKGLPRVAFQRHRRTIMGECTEVYIVRVDVFVYYALQFHHTYVIRTCFTRERGSEPSEAAGDGIRREFSLCLLWRRIHTTHNGLIFLGCDL